MDRRTLSQQGMQPSVMNHSCISGENCRLHRCMARVGKASTERDLNNVFEVKLNFIGCQSIEKSIERLLEFGFELFDNGHNFFNSRLVDHTARPIDKQTDIFVELNVRSQFHP